MFVQNQGKWTFVNFREESSIVSKVDEVCKLAGVNRSTFMRVALRKALMLQITRELKQEQPQE